ncbi:MAG: exosome complex protein Rrp42 [Candidatus Aenigmatarchaeota archaeon]
MIMLDKEMVKEMISKQNTRIDERRFDEYRKIKIEQGIIENAEGSARVEIGNTKVIAGVKIESGEPFPDRPDEGVIVVGGEFVPFASPEFSPGPPSDEAIELARVVDRVIRESNAIDLKKMVINKANVWRVMIDILVLDNDGNLFDTAVLAAVAALLNAKMPIFKIDDEKVEIDYYNKGTEPLPIIRKPVSVTIAKVSNALIVDPNLVEEETMDALLTIGSFEDNDNIFLCAMQKGGSKGFTKEEIEDAIDLAIEKGKELRMLL